MKIYKFTVYLVVAEKKLQVFKVGTQWRFKRTLLEARLRKNMRVSMSS